LAKPAEKKKRATTMDVRGGILLLFVATCCSGVTISDLKFDGYLGDFVLTNDIGGSNKLTCTVTATADEATNDISFKITNDYDKSIFCSQTLKSKDLSNPIPITCEFKVDLSAKIKDDFKNKIKFTAEATPKGVKDPTKSTPAEVNILDIQAAKKQTTITTDKCDVKLDIYLPFTFPKGRAECGVLNDKKTFVNEAGLYFDSDAKPQSDWKTDYFSKDDKIRQSLTLKSTINLKKLRGREDLTKQIKCKLSWPAPYSYTFSPEIDYSPKVENDADRCGPNPLDGIDKINTNIKLMHEEPIESCYLEDKVNRLSYYKCDYDKRTIEAVCDPEKEKTYKLRIDNGEFKPYTDATAKKFIDDCLHEPKTLKVHPVEVEGAFKNVIQKSGKNQNTTCSFDVDDEDIYADLTATVTFMTGGGQIGTKDIKINKGDFNGTKTFNAEVPLPATGFKVGKPVDLRCKVKLGKYAKEVLVESKFEVFDIQDGPSETDVKVDNENCEVDFNMLYRQPTNPEGLAFCGIWVSPTADVAKGDWLEGPEAELISPLSFSSNRNGTRWVKNVGPKGFTQFTLKNQKIAISNLESEKYSWVRCDWMFPHFNSSLEDAVISSFHSEIRAQNEADTCPENPVSSKDLTKKNAKKTVNLAKTSCYAGKAKKEISVNVRCTNTKNVVSVTCENGAYVMKTASKSKGEAYTEDKFDKFLETCGAGSVFVSNVLMGVLMLVLYFKSQ